MTIVRPKHKHAYKKLYCPSFLHCFTGFHTNQEPNQGATIENQQHCTEEHVLPPSDTLLNAANDNSFYPTVSHLT